MVHPVPSYWFAGIARIESNCVVCAIAIYSAPRLLQAFRRYDLPWLPQQRNVYF